ncbi:hypothetical protein HJG54_24960 [Leptolyngbya sp. NK1-12]|uniref:Uncharacterized protein n=1 Tax=Leptolyngbya sp. NK1-12 TaxID=2547451 RepID=A0AA96WIF8_9CYAN|nr:hypothetical protein [Leptolyngbya sp. NK1-12]WNZ25765.1 hypothetical protein HJG54_24960 [Leptolyngbya sp. NK1-12]
MLSLYSQLTAYQQMRREHRTQMSDRLSQLYQEVQDQLETLRQQEELAIKAEEEVLSRFRAFIGADARCLLSTPELAAYAKSISVESFCKQPDSPYSIHFDIDPGKWLLQNLPAPIQILEFSRSWEDVDGEDKESPKTYWLYWLSVKISSYQQRFYIPTADEIPDLSATYRSLPLIAQYYDCCRKLKLDAKALQVKEAQVGRITQELSCLLVAVGSLFNPNRQTEHFCYPRPQ